MSKRRLNLVLALLACAAWQSGWLGCVSESKKTKPALSFDFGSSPIQEINLLAVPVALNFDQNPGADGFVIKVYASSPKRAKPVPIESGKIEVLMFDGIPDLQGAMLRKPLRTWTFTAEELKAFEIRTSIGTGYQLVPVWGDAKPSGDKISVVVRYMPPQGPSVTSAASIISIGVR